MDSNAVKRITVKPTKCPNPLFYKWLSEWKKEAKEKGSEMKYVYSKALASLSKYPLVLKSGQECGILQNFGVKLCSMLDKKLAEHDKNFQLGYVANHISEARSEETVNKRIVKSPIKQKKAISSKKKLSSNETNSEEILILEPGTFKITLVVDSGETSGFKGRSGIAKNPNKDQTLNHLSALKVPFEVRKLSVGDFAWACIPNSFVATETAPAKMEKKILMLPYIIERKRVDDLGSSIRDGRFHEQKFRLKRSGMWQLIYLVEGISEKLGMSEREHSRGLHLPMSTLQQASVNTEVVDHFIVKDTKGQKETAEYLATMTKFLTHLFKGKFLKRCKKDDLPTFSVNDEMLHLMSLSELNKSSLKCKDLTVSQMFIRHLLQIRGLTVEKAVAIIEKYPTPADLIKAYEENEQQKHNLLSKIPFGPQKRLIGPALSKVISDLYTNDVLT